MGRWGEWYRGRGRGWIQVPGRGDATKLWLLIQAEAGMVEVAEAGGGAEEVAGRAKGGGQAGSGGRPRGDAGHARTRVRR